MNSSAYGLLIRLSDFKTRTDEFALFARVRVDASLMLPLVARENQNSELRLNYVRIYAKDLDGSNARQRRGFSAFGYQTSPV